MKTISILNKCQPQWQERVCDSHHERIKFLNIKNQNLQLHNKIKTNKQNLTFSLLFSIAQVIGLKRSITRLGELSLSGKQHDEESPFSEFLSLADPFFFLDSSFSAHLLGFKTKFFMFSFNDLMDGQLRVETSVSERRLFSNFLDL